MGRFGYVDVEIFINENGTTYAGHSDRSFTKIEVIDRLGYQTMNRPMVASRAEMERNVLQALGPFKHLLHKNP